MCIRRASRGRLDFPVSCSEVAGNWGGFATEDIGADEVVCWVVCGAGLLEEGASAGGVSGWFDAVVAFAAGLGEVMMSKREMA